MAARKPRTLMDRALAFLAMREHTRKELEQKLLRPARVPVLQDEVTRVLDELAAKGFQSDTRAVQSLITSQSGKAGKRKLEHTLKQRGAPSHDIQQALHGHNDYDACLNAWTKKFGAPAEDLKAKQKQLRFLAARGFEMDSIRKVMHQAGSSIDDDACD
jgi:regulatory protein